MFSLIPQGIDRVKAGSFAGRIDAEEETDTDGEREGYEDRRRRDDGLEFADMRDGDGDGATKSDAEDAADDSHDDGFDEELQHDVAEGRAERLPYADLTRALRDRDHHDVHDADAADEERDARNRAEEER